MFCIVVKENSFYFKNQVEFRGNIIRNLTSITFDDSLFSNESLYILRSMISASGFGNKTKEKYQE
jgi:hypothetical protein